jgi:tetratricopeptide (TPR) repeat protein
MKKISLIIFCILILPSRICLSRNHRLENEGKRGLHARSIEEVLRLSDDEIDLATAALIVSEQWSDMVHGRTYLSRLDEMAFEIQKKLDKRWLKPTYKAIPVINDYLFRELKFKAVPEADNPNALFLHTVLDNKQGYCLSLSILYLSLAERLGLPMYGVVVPGHFFVRYDDGQTRWNIETTQRGGSATDKYYIDKYKVPTGNDNSIYMKNLNKIQTLGCLFNNLGNSYNDIGNTEDASLVLQRAVTINPTLSESRANLGNVYLRKGQIDEAVYEYLVALEINPGDAKTHNNLGNAYFRQDRMQDAISQYALSLKLDPNYVDAYQNIAVAYSRQEKFGYAILNLKQALDLKPEMPGLYSQLGEVYFMMGDYGASAFQYKKAVSLKKDFAEAHYGLGICYNKLGLADKEIQEYLQALAIQPNMLPALLNLANAYFSKKDYDSAIEYYNKAVLIKPDDSLVLYNLGAAFFNKGDFEQAVAEYLMVIAIDPKMSNAHYGLAVALYKLKRYEQAWEHIKIAKELGVDVPKDLFNDLKNKQRQDNIP